MGRRRDFDVLRAVACLGVVYLHVAAPALRQFENMGVWHISNLLTSLCTAAVPVFFMMSGALALGSGKTADVRDLLTRRLWRVAVPFAVWTALMLCYYLWRDGVGFAQKALEQVLVRPVTTPYWFLYGYLSLLLLSPLLKRMVDAMEEVHWKYLLGLWFVLTVLSHTVRGFLPYEVGLRLGWYPGYSLSFLGGMLGYYLLGYRLSTVKVTGSAWKFGAVAAGCVLLIAMGTVWSSGRLGQYSEQFKSYLSLPVALLSASLFLFARAAFDGKASGKVLSSIANASFGVYLSHPLLMDVIRHALSGEELIAIDTLKIQGVYFLLVAVSSVLVSLAAERIPVVRYFLLGNRRKKG